MALRTLILRTPSSLFPLISARSFASNCALPPLAARAAPLLRLRPLVSAAWDGWAPTVLARGGGSARSFSMRPTTSSLHDPSPNWSHRPPKETILLDGCDFEHWLVVMEPPEGEPTRDDIIDSYIRTLAQVIGSEDEARMKIYSVSTRHYFAFGALVSEDLSYKIKALPRVRWVLPDSYLNVKEKDYGGEPFIDGKAVPYDPKYHEEWVRNNARSQERSRRNDRPRSFDRSRNYERRRENMQNRDFQNRAPPPMPNQQFQSNETQNPLPPRDMPTGPGTHGAMPPPVPPPGNMPPGSGMPPPGNMPPPGSGTPNPSFQGAPNRDYQNQVPTYQGNYPGTNPYQGAPAHQGGSGPYPGSGSAPQQVAGNAYQGGGGGSYQGGGAGYQGGGGGAGYQGGNGGGYPGAGNPYQGGGGPYQGGGNAYQGGGGGGYPGGGSASQGGGGGGYPGGGSASQGGGGSFQSGGNPYQGRDMPGRD